MQIVIDIPKDRYDEIHSLKFVMYGLQSEKNKQLFYMLINAVQDGTVLPEPHGELVDIRPLMRGLYEEIQVGELTYTTSEVYKMIEEETSTIIEADERNEDEVSN